eukprot:CAMPEP_0173406658 /NCGR_PEP_ID=MMETSP1356-20130122/65122_1 /TAXON_ID=77927 ORGANISM="Hemiselmis virescens, Strain PCC157" /NCGR_SAMPLE_ID=MMETSP1356 /ASSEMBLY_ACC=CAM_ASM_000847 /LENGTH=43 /DNA_ID= /DNA_START= /DNA_END= /DNA_ORIENTATION=
MNFSATPSLSNSPLCFLAYVRSVFSSSSVGIMLCNDSKRSVVS